ncbi:MAG: hypothetical protein A2W05_08880 [Candidatus Schekmanbacteria bacterium RBG_16_38_10]|uniref:Glycosyltransferase RgtA/B/C/D-like domain-containing protein n=1 Tax=Candidatus Schekmanbacteria bacterium RBG_16_38_10 TaxID=1817879 RepID=A0A1F7S0T7_9BACT|nr:MAG: hypothetical protein A2W05_08880 [Candidatus Schekmanbacteria bacterium RBG_16_38_10]
MIPLVKSYWFKILTIIIVSILFALYLWGNNLHANWDIIDDHEIMSFLGTDGNVRLTEIQDLLLHTEVGRPGHSLRYRPSYYFIRIFEAFLWGNSPHLWHLCRLILFAISAGILWWIVDKYVGLVVGMLFVGYVVIFPFWSDIWVRLGPAETYAVFGTAIYSLGYINILRSIKKEAIFNIYLFINWNMVLLGAVISMGSKENFLILLIPSLFLFIFLWRRHLLNMFSLIYSLLIFSYGSFITIAVGMALSKNKKDIYANSVEPLGRLEIAFHGIRKVFTNNYLLLTIFVLLLLIFLIFIYQMRQKKMDATQLFHKAVTSYVVASIIIFLLYISQYVFYAGKWPINRRYDFPGVLSAPFFMLVTVIFLLNISMILKRSRLMTNVILISFSLILIMLIAINGYSGLRRASQSNVLRTRAFTDRLSVLVKVLNNDPKSALLFESYYAPRDYEPISSVSRYLRVYNIQNPFYLTNITNRSGNTDSELEDNLLKGLNNISVNGGNGDMSWDFRPISELNGTPNKCYSISFSAPPSSDCRHIGQIW